MKPNKSERICVRVTTVLAERLRIEAEAAGMDVSNYIRHMVATHPDRLKYLESGIKQAVHHGK